MKPFPAWKTVLLVIVACVGLLYSLPNIYGDDPSVQIMHVSGDPLPADFEAQIQRILDTQGLQPLGSGPEEGQWVVRFEEEMEQLAAADALRRDLERGYVVALNLAPKTPAWLANLGAKPMNLGLDLRGGVHFLIEVSAQDAVRARINDYSEALPRALREANIRYTGRRLDGDAVVMEFMDADTATRARRSLASAYDEMVFNIVEGPPVRLEVRLSPDETQRILDFALRQNLTTLRNRVNQLGVAEPIVQRQGANRIVVQLPGVQDTTRVKDLLGATATLEYRAVDEEGDPRQVARTGIVPFGTELFQHRDGYPVLLKRDIIATGNQIVDAQATVDQDSGSPAVSVTLDSRGADSMFRFTQRNVGRPMAVLYRETEIVTRYDAQGNAIRERNEIEEVISIATIRGVFGKRFQTTGLTSREAQNLALQLRAGALAAPIEIVEERTVGPSMGQDNIDRGQMAALIGFLAVVAFMAVYYKVFGLVANVALVLNLVVLVAAMSLIQATLTMPGIAGIVLTLGMAVDANVLIYERIREELFKGTPALKAIDAGYDRAFLTIADSQITTLIAAVVLFALGSGPVKGFAVTLTIGIATSMFTAIVGTRAIVHMIYGSKTRLRDLPI